MQVGGDCSYHELEAPSLEKNAAANKFPTKMVVSPTVDDLKSVKGIGDKTFEKLKAYIVCNPLKK